MAALIKDASRPRTWHVPQLPHPIPVPPPRAELDWAASGWAGLVAGLVMLTLETFMWPLLHGGSLDDGVRRIAAIALGQQVLTTTRFTGFVVLAALMMHLPLSLVYARLLGVAIRRRPLAQSLGIGAAFGAALYALNFHALTSMGLFEWFIPLRGLDTLAFHVVWGLVAAFVYEWRAMRDRESERLSRDSFPGQ